MGDWAPLWKEQTIARDKARRKRLERKVVHTVRMICVLRDGLCRLSSGILGPCSGPSEWAHLPSHRRSRTRAQAPSNRHTPAGSMMLCRAHHDRLDGRARPVITIEEGILGADGPLLVQSDGVCYVSAPRQ
jgi:hypothetical protein